MHISMDLRECTSVRTAPELDFCCCCCFFFFSPAVGSEQGSSTDPLSSCCTIVQPRPQCSVTGSRLQRADSNYPIMPGAACGVPTPHSQSLCHVQVLLLPRSRYQHRQEFHQPSVQGCSSLPSFNGRAPKWIS